jgi:bifunctional non-homologous end joining protein LigD
MVGLSGQGKLDDRTVMQGRFHCASLFSLHCTAVMEVLQDQGAESAYPRWVNPLLERVPDADRRRLKRRAPPRWISPMLATLTKQVFSDPEWICEAKLDGQRSLLFKRGVEIHLMTRNEKDRTSHYPDLVEAIEAEDTPDLIADGEIVAFDGARTSFSRLQERMQNRHPTPEQVESCPVFYYLFDLVWFDGYDLTALPLRARKEVLAGAFAFEGTLRFSDHVKEEGEVAFRAACARGEEGLIAKRLASPYTSGRSRDWLKFKCVNDQEFVIVGWTDPAGSRSDLGALLVAYNEDGRLRYAGKVGTGFKQHDLRMLSSKLHRLERASPPVADVKSLPRKGVHWVTPRLVAEIGFSEWTPDGHLRHPRYLGLRNDKAPGEVVRETR